MANLLQYVPYIAERGDHSFLPHQIAIYFAQMVQRQESFSCTVSGDILYWLRQVIVEWRKNTLKSPVEGWKGWIKADR